MPAVLVNPHRFATAAGGDAALTFTGANGAPWPSPWVTSTGGLGALCDIQASRGRQLTSDTAGSYQAARAFYGSTGYTDTDTAARLALANPIVEQYAAIAFRADSWWSNNDYPANGYVFQCRPHASTLVVFRSSGGAITTLTSVPYTFTAGTDVWMKLRLAGSSIQGRAWNVGTTEPTTWAVELTDATHPSGKWGLSTASGPANVACYWDDITFSVSTGTGPYFHLSADTLIFADASTDVRSGGSGGGTQAKWSDTTNATWSDLTAANWST